MAQNKNKFGLGFYNPASGFLIQNKRVGYDDPILSGGASTMTGSSMPDSLLNKIRQAAGMQRVDRKVGVPTQETDSSLVQKIREGGIGSLFETDPILAARMEAAAAPVSPYQESDEAFDLSPLEPDIFSPDSSGGISGALSALTGKTDMPGMETFGGTIPEGAGTPTKNNSGDITSVAEDLAAMAGAEAKEADETSPMTLMAEAEAQESDEAFKTGETQSVAGGAGEATNSAGKTKNMYESLMDSALTSYNEAIGRAPSGAKSMADYKKEFSEATGIDISGDPDNKAALLAFGLALMQNKAGKGFDVGKMLSSVGEAGEKALPLMEKARQEARQGKLAAGQYALQEAKTANSARQQFLVDQSNYLTKRRDTILDAATARINSIEDREDKQNAQIQLERIKSGFDQQLKLLELDRKGAQKLAEGKYKTTDTKDLEDPALKGLTLTMGNRESDGRAVFLYPAQQAEIWGSALADTQEGISSLDEMSRLVMSVKDMPGGTNLQKAQEWAQGISSSFGFSLNEEPQFDKDGNFTGMKADSKPLQTADAIRDRVLSQYKRFLTQETGNGISNVDIQRVEAILGKVDFFGDPEMALKRIEEAKKIFQSKKDKVTTYMDMLSDKTRYKNEQEYIDTRKAIDGAISRSYKFKNIGGYSETKDPDTGLTVIKLG